MHTNSYSALIPAYEDERLAALHPYRILSTPGLTVFDRFVEVVARLLDVPIALISLVREDDVIFVGNVGLPTARTVGRGDSMCSVAILNEGFTVYEDMLANPCTLVNPAIARQLKLGFYAGTALRAPGGMAVGSLCVLDRRPRTIGDAETRLLAQLALVAQELLGLQAAYAAGAPAAALLHTHLDELLQDSLSRLGNLAMLRGWDSLADPSEDDRYTNARLEQAGFLARQLHQLLQAALSGHGPA